jgi:hypothetical protein
MVQVRCVQPEPERAQDARRSVDLAVAYRHLNLDDRPRWRRATVPSVTYQRPRDIKTSYDPHDLFLSNHPVPPGPAARPDA